MLVEFKLPDVGEGMHEGEVIRLIVNVGDRVQADQPIIEVQTDKVTVELPSPVAGVIESLPVKPGKIVPVGEVVAVINTGDNEGSAVYVPQDDSSVQKDNRNLTRVIKKRIIAAPSTRRLARELGVDIELVHGTGSAGRVMDRDVQSFAATHQLAHEEVRNEMQDEVRDELRSVVLQTIPIRGLRKKIAEKMVKSKFTIPHVTHFDELDVTELIKLRNTMKSSAGAKGVKLTFLPFIIKALAVATREYPIFNATMDEAANEIILHPSLHVGIAVDTEEGLIVPVIHHVHRKGLLQLASEITDLAEKAKTKKLTLAELSGGTFTISNVGPIGGLFATPIINHPEVALLALHKMEEKAVVVNREIVIRDRMNFSLSFDHRVVDGVTAVRFTNRIRALIEKPGLLWMEDV